MLHLNMEDLDPNFPQPISSGCSVEKYESFELSEIKKKNISRPLTNNLGR
jgi:hypothetical protein